MALSYSNTLSPQGFRSPLSASALANAKANKLGAGISIAPLSATSKGAVGGNVIKTPAPTPAPAVNNMQPMKTNTVSQPNYSPSGGSSGMTGLLAGLQSQLSQKEGELAKAKEKEKSEKKTAAWEKLRAKEAGAAGSATPTYSGLVGDLSKLAKEGSSGFLAANSALTDFRKNAANYQADIYSAPTSARVMQGRGQAVQLANAQTDAALAAGVTNALTGQGQQLTALQGAAGLAAPTAVSPGSVAINPLTGEPIASAPTQVPYGTQFLDPATGLPMGGGAAAGGSLNPIAAIPSYAQQVAGGGMSYDQAMAALGGNPAFAAELNAQIRAINPNFSAVQSNANAAVQGTTLQQTAQQSNALQLASQNAYKALTLLNESYNGLTGLQKTPIPLVNKGANLISSNLGLNAAGTQQYQTAIQEARAAVSQVLSAVGNTPTYSESTAKAIIPDNAGPDQIASAIRTVEQLIEQKVSSFSQPGIAPQFGGGAPGSGGLFDW